MFLEVVNAKYLDGFRVEVSFNNKIVKTVNFEEYLLNENRKILQPLKDKSFFSTVFAHPEFGTLSWKPDIDIAPEFVFDFKN